MKKIFEYQKFMVSLDDGKSFLSIRNVEVFPQVFVDSPAVFIRLENGLLIDLLSGDEKLKIRLLSAGDTPCLSIRTTQGGDWPFYWDGSSWTARDQLTAFRDFLNEQLGRK